MVINSLDDLIHHLLKDFPKRLLGTKDVSYSRAHTVKSKVFKGYTFTGKFAGVLFKGCKFVDCRFDGVFGFFCLFEDCKFHHTTFLNSRFSHFEFHWKNLAFNECYFKAVQLDEGTFFNVEFNECQFDMFNMTGFVAVENTLFIRCSVQFSNFVSLIHYSREDELNPEFPDLYFEWSIVDFSNFKKIDLRNSKFMNSVLAETSFVDCEFNSDTISVTEELKFKSNGYLDLQTILKSEQIDFNILKQIFKVHDPNIQETLKKITEELNYQKVFISFSFEDKRFAERLHLEFESRGIRTFFWMKDAPPGQSMEDIMREGVRSTDKLLFIASKNSIKSIACQFELSEGRRKQTETWENIIFPIHIDDFIFKVNKSQIRPIEKMEEYWRNIEEIKRVNSADFSEFNKGKINHKKFKQSIDRIVKELEL
jgi:uncharacterized protein YjbI with pentapeptide repeats